MWIRKKGRIYEDAEGSLRDCEEYPQSAADPCKFCRKKSKGVRFTPDQINYLRNTAASMETLNKSLEEKNRRMQELQLEFNPQERAMVQVRGEVYPGTTIIIGDSSMQVKSTYHYCRFERIDGDVKSTPL